LEKFITTAFLTFFVSLGVILGGSLMGALGASLIGRPPMDTMLELGEEMRIWALVTAVGGTFGVIKAFETGILGGQPVQLLQQFSLVCCAFGGAHLGFLILSQLAGGPR